MDTSNSRQSAVDRRESVRVGVLGCGRIAQAVHLPLLARMRGVELVAYAELDTERRMETCRTAPGARGYQHYEELLAADDIEAVVIDLPNALHAEAALAAMGNGKHVYVEKPLATELDDGFQVVHAWRQAGVVGMPGFNYRFNPLYRALRTAITSGSLGRPVAARSIFSTPRHALAPWRHQRHTGGGVLLDLASHHADLMRFLFDGEILEVSAASWSLRDEGDTAVVRWKCDDDIHVQSFFSTSTADEDELEIYLEGGRLRVNRYRSLSVEVIPSAKGSTRRPALNPLRMLRAAKYALFKRGSPWREPSFGLALAEFVSAVRQQRQPSPDLWDGCCSLAAIAAAEESARRGRTVVVPGMQCASVAR